MRRMRGARRTQIKEMDRNELDFRLTLACFLSWERAIELEGGNKLKWGRLLRRWWNKKGKKELKYILLNE